MLNDVISTNGDSQFAEKLNLTENEKIFWGKHVKANEEMSTLLKVRESGSTDFVMPNNQKLILRIFDNYPDDMDERNLTYIIPKMVSENTL